MSDQNENHSASETAEKPEDMPQVNQMVDEADGELESQPDEVEAVETTNTYLDELEAEIERNKQGWQRSVAEFQNYKRRVEREQHNAKLEVLGKLLPIIDDFERAMENLPDDLQDHPWLGGVNLIQGKFKRLLEEYEVAVINPAGEPFDPNLHQAIAMEDSDEVESGHVIDTLQKGYISGDYLLRPAIVRVAN